MGKANRKPLEGAPTIGELSAMTVIQMHHLINTKFPQFGKLADIHHASVLRNKLIEELGIQI